MEVTVTIDGETLSIAQTMALRVSVSRWRMELSMHTKPLIPLDKAYLDRLIEVERLLTLVEHMV